MRASERQRVSGQLWPAWPGNARRARRARAAAVALLALAAVLVPLGRSKERDSFPLSNFPMFTHDPTRITGFVRAVGVTDDGSDVVLSPELAGGTIEVIHAAQTLSTAIRQGQAGDLCAEIAERVSRAQMDVAEILIVTDRYDIVEGLRAVVPEPVGRDEHAACEVVER